ncbi:amino acid adenylation domain-containing protein [Streptomyces sp. NPDC017056]|uniref:amino acid adenylation domain-containing protein n=1 Tax=Streptomyces sp. NPDC017056 TaxID=3364973 RepID=UPI00379B1777
MSTISGASRDQREAAVDGFSSGGPDISLTELFRAVARKYPSRVAVTAEDGEFTYQEIDARSEVIAGELVAAGVTPGHRVGLCVARESGMVAGLLAVLKCGAAYVPMDADHPAERLRWTLRDSGAAAVVTSSDLAASVAGSEVRTVRLDRLPADGPPRAEISPPRGTDPAYVIYTSGSTGEPKGVPIAHRQVVRLFSETRDWFGFGPDDVWTVFHSAAFDFSVWEMWGALLHGGRLVVVPRDVARSPAAFHELLCSERVTVLNQTPSSFRRLAAADARATRSPDHLRTVVLGGERLDPTTLRDWIARHGDERPRLVNMYGITEATVHASYRRVLRADLDAGGPSPIGVPLPDLTFHVRGPDGEPVPDGQPGELYIEGPGVASGYLGRTELTRERFSSDGAAHRVLRTGDRVVRLGDGQYGYLGRTDDQIKIRGFRVEPGEVEALLTGHPSVASAAVLPRDYGEDDVRLIAYVVPAGTAANGAYEKLVGELRDLAGTLPAHLRPSAYERLDALPLTPHGKTDRAALLALAGNGHRPTGRAGLPADGPAAPHATTQERITAIWRTVLDTEDVAPDADFFDLGGTSLTLLRMFEQVNTAFGTDLDITVLIEGATVGSLASHVDAATAPDATRPRTEEHE